MRRLLKILSLLLAAVATSVGCDKKENAPPNSARPTPQSSPATLPATNPTTTLIALPTTSPANPESALVLYVSVNGSVRSEVSKDWPLVVQAQVFLKPGAGKSRMLSNPPGPWTDALKLECTGPDNVDRAANFSPAFASNKSIELTNERSGVMVWILDGSRDAALAEGAWQIRVTLDERKLGNADAVVVASNRAEVSVVPIPAKLSPRAAQKKCLAAMTACAWKDDVAGALAAAEAHLAANPDDVAVLFMKGQVLRSKARNAEALASFQAARKAANRSREKLAENFAIDEAIAELQRELQHK